MITIPYETVKERIRAQAGLTDAAIEQKVTEKLAGLAGLISRDGAIHIVANELGVKLIPDRENLKVKDLLAGMRVTINLRVLRKYEARTFQRDGREGSVASFLAGDESGVIRVTLWNDHTPLLNQINEGDTVQVKEGQVKDNQGRIEMSLGNGASLVINPAGIIVEASSAPVERSFTRKKISELAANDEYVDILGTIVQVYDPRTFVKKTGGSGVVANAVIDDGTGTIRVSFWDNDCKTLLGDAVDKPELLPDVKLELLGQIVKVQGRCKLNAAYNTLELSASSLVKNPDPAAEMARLG